MKLGIYNEFSPLLSVFVCWGYGIPEYDSHSSDDPEFLKYHNTPWDKDLYIKQQEGFFKTLEKYNVKLLFPKTSEKLFWQSYTRDTAFVIYDKLYYSDKRNFGDRNGEDAALLDTLALDENQIEVIPFPIEGGDVLVKEAEIYVGNGSRTSIDAVTYLAKDHTIKSFHLGDNVMHLDTRLTIMPNNIALCHTDSFSKEDQSYLNSKYELVYVTLEETQRLGTNMFVINPETIAVPKEHERIAKLLMEKGFKIESIDYTEPIALGGSFRCTTMPLLRE